MTYQLTYDVIADGGTDRAPVPILNWAIHRLDPHVEILEPVVRKRKGSVGQFLQSYQTGAMLVFMHRDAEGESLSSRLSEFPSGSNYRVVPVVPVRMTEAWLLISSEAIAAAADRPDQAVDLPPLTALESLANPKQVLENCLRSAAGDPTGRRRKKFDASLVTRRVNVANLIRDYSALEQVAAFRQFQVALAREYPYTTS